MRRAEAEKERGVALYRAGRFRAAVRAYDACATRSSRRSRRAPSSPTSSTRAKRRPKARQPRFFAARQPSLLRPSLLRFLRRPRPDLRRARRRRPRRRRARAHRRPEPVAGRADDCALLMNAALLNAALAASKRGDDASCERYCARVLDRDPGGDPRNVKALFRRGRARVALGRGDDAEDDFARAEKIDPTVARDVAAERRKRARGARGSGRGVKTRFPTSLRRRREIVRGWMYVSARDMDVRLRRRGAPRSRATRTFRPAGVVRRGFWKV